jgi:phage-related protein
MNIQERKINLLKEIININDVDLINKIEDVLLIDSKKTYISTFVPMTESELNIRVSEAEADYQNGRLTDAVVLLKEIDTWN